MITAYSESVARYSAIAILALVLGACASTPSESPEAPEAITPPATEAPPPVAEEVPPPSEPERPLDILTIAAVGDIMIGTDFPKNRLPDDDGAGFFDGVAALLQTPDITFGNLEGVLIDGGEPAKKCSNPAACYLFRSPTRYASVFANAGFDALSLANNHARDFGEEGRSASMQALSALGIQHSGRDGEFAEWQHGSTRIALAAFAVTRNSNPMLEVDLAPAAVYELASRNGLVIVSFHGGAEGLDALHIPFAEETYYDEPRGDVVRFSRAVIDAGADLVLGHGPHVVRAMEVYQQRLIAYSLGNFATYYGISVAGLKGIAPILEARIRSDGLFIDGQIHSTVQIRPGGPVPDNTQAALQWIQKLSREDFGTPGLQFDEQGRITLSP